MTSEQPLVIWAAAILSVLLSTMAIGAEAGPANDKARFYVGTYTRQQSKGIYLYEMDLKSGQAQPLGVAAETTNPSFLAIHPNRRFLFAVSEADKFAGQKGGGVSAFAIGADGKLTALNGQPSGGSFPCHLAVDPTGKCVLVANYGSGTIEAVPVGDDGKLGPPNALVQHAGKGADPKRQEGPHAHSVYFDPAGKLALACDLGLDKIMLYRLDAGKAALTPADPPFATVAPGSGPRHLAFSPNGKFVYVINEMGNTITAFAYDAGQFKQVQTISTLPADFNGRNTTAEIEVHPSGKFLYGSNRGHDSIAIFSADPATGMLAAVGHQSTEGKNPRSFAIDPTGQFLLAANQDAGGIVIFKIDAQNGKLAPTGSKIDVPFPVCVVFVK